MLYYAMFQWFYYECCALDELYVWHTQVGMRARCDGVGGVDQLLSPQSASVSSLAAALKRAFTMFTQVVYDSLRHYTGC